MRIFLFIFLAASPCSLWSQFGPENVILERDSPISILAVDLDNDGDDDLISGYSETDKIVWFENDGAGNFNSVVEISDEVDGLVDVIVADLDGDGDIDVLSASSEDDKVAWYENMGGGNMSSQNIISTSGNSVQSIFASDLDGDGDQDVLAASWIDDKVVWYENLGSGVFSVADVLSNTVDKASKVFAADLDGDGDFDVLSASYGEEKIELFENLGGGEFSSENTIVSGLSEITTFLVTDLNEDGYLDVIYAINDNSILRWKQGYGDGTFSPSFGGIPFFGVEINSINGADLDNDGDIDLFLTDKLLDRIEWIENTGEGTFSDSVLLTEECDDPRAACTADIDSDGDKDIVTVSYLDDKIIWHENSGEGDFTQEHAITETADNAESVFAADIDGDGDSDILSASYNDDKIAWYENQGDGNFTFQKTISDSADGAISVFAADMDLDGDIDVLSASYFEDKVVWYENLSNGETFTEHIISSTVIGVQDIYVIDLDGDGDKDVISASPWNSEIAWHENIGSGIFSSDNTITLSAFGAIAVFAADLDNDGDQDVLSASINDDKVAWYENLGNGDFSSENILSTTVDETSVVHAADIDGDGDLDVLSCAGSMNGTIIWFENLGDGSFSEENVISNSLNSPNSIVAFDMDNDGDIDLSVACGAASVKGFVTWFENSGDGSYFEEKSVSVDARMAESVYAEDLDGDGDLELITASSFYDKIAWHENLTGNGCTNPEACNYDQEAYIENGSCCFGICGCTDPVSTSYFALAECDNGSCKYRLNGAVFYDENEDGAWDTTEYGLPFHEVIIQPMGWTTLTNDAGYFSFIGPGLGEYSAELIPDENFPFLTTTNPFVFDVIWDYPTSDIIFGVSNEEPLFGICVDFYSSGNGYPCNDLVNHNICYRNEGNVPIDGIVEVEYDIRFQDYQEVTPVDSVVADKIYLSFENLLPGQMFLYDVELKSPTVEYIGDILTSTTRIYGFYEGEQVAYGEKELNVEMTCSYDPNDKQVFPNGHLEEHLILNETELEYLIRFQNTGNAPATNVLVTDTIDENLDLETFALVANSHSVQTTIKPDERVIQFFFENIMLPDSTANEPESHGLISYKITPYPNLEPGTVLNNTGNIYFDNNPPIITNTTWNTIHECGGEAGYTVLSETECNGIYVEISTNYPWLETISWSSDDVELSSSETLNLSFTELGSHEYTLLASNSLCEESVTIIHEVDELPQLPPCFADFNCDGHRNIIDLLDFLPEFGCLSDCEKDLDNDGIISVFDLSIFLGLVGDDCEE